MAPSGPKDSGGWSGFAKNILIPLSIALLLYLVIFQAIIPLYHRYRTYIARYSSYTPLNSTSTLRRRTMDVFNPLIEPSRSILKRATLAIRLTLWRWAVPGLPNMDFARQDTREPDQGEEMRGDLDADETGSHNGLDAFDFSSDEDSDYDNNEEVMLDANMRNGMTGFDVRSSFGDGRRFNLRGQGRGRARSTNQRPRIRAENERRGMERRRVGSIENDRFEFENNNDDSNTRLSRELEEGFRDDSASEDDLVTGVTVGRSRNRDHR